LARQEDKKEEIKIYPHDAFHPEFFSCLGFIAFADGHFPSPSFPGLAASPITEVLDMSQVSIVRIASS